MDQIVLETLWFLLPAAAANMAPVLVAKVPLLRYPIDHYRTFRGQRVFGDHKTYRGFFFGVLAAIAVVCLQQQYVPIDVSFINYQSVSALWLGLALGGGALLGDAVASFFKRQVGVAPGKPWPPFDQLDWVIGALVCVTPILIVPLPYVIAALLLFLILHPAANYLGYLLKIKKNKW